jgi:PAS domain S-box-containing protein
MIAHAQKIKEKLGQASAVVFIGPCVAKKSEADRPQYKGVIDVVLTFTELDEWLKKRGVSLAGCEESGFDDEPQGAARLFPIPGGLMKTAQLNGFELSDTLLHVSGVEQVREALKDISRKHLPCLIEPLWCTHGCINGPGITGRRNVFERRKDVLHYAAAGAENASVPLTADEHALLSTSYQQAVNYETRKFTENDIIRVLERTGKSSPEQQLNCGACGYNSCRDKAVAVLQGMAEPEMCLPYMRRMAERRTDRIIETSPNGIIILDSTLEILSMNPAFRRFFSCSDAVLGRKISYIIDPEPFEKVASGFEDSVNVIKRYDAYNIVCNQFVYPLREERQYVGIFVNITKSHGDQEELELIKHRTVMQAQELLDHQVQMAQTIAKFLGESTAKSEELVSKLLSMTGEGDEAE